jgi:D-alanyl-D-alanine dipeptidase
MTNEGWPLVKAIVIALVVAACVSPASAQSLPGGFVYLRDIDPSILQDIRYAGSNNFVGRPLKGYDAAECVVKREVGLKLKAIQQELARQKLSLKMLDCYRLAANCRQSPTRRLAFLPAGPRQPRHTDRGNLQSPRKARAPRPI